MSRLADIPTVVVSGARGAGKTTLLARWLVERPAAERCAVLVTERGAASLPHLANVVAVEAEPGCICCTGQVSLRIALTRLLREALPKRLYLELGEPAHLAAALRTLRDPWLAPVVTLVDVVGVVVAAAPDEAAASEAWLAQLTALHVRNDADGAYAARVVAQRPELRLLT